MKRSRGRPPSSNSEKSERFRADPNHVAAMLASNYVRGCWELTPSCGLKRISHKLAVQFAMDEYDRDWLVSRQGKPPKRPDPAQVSDLLRRGRTSPKIDPMRDLSD
jgi:hypothetical protein